MATRRRVWTVILLAIAVLPGWAAAQTTAPTTQRTPVAETPPPEFIRVTAGAYSAFCQPVDEAWVKQGLAQAKATALPSTRPADIISRVAAHREELIKGLANDLDIEASKVAAMIDEQLLPTLKKLDDVQPPVVFIVATEQKIKTLLNSGWSHPRVHYNRLMDQLKWDEKIFLSIDQPMDESLMHATYDATDPPATRVKKLREAAEKFESDVAYSIAGRARVVVQVTLAGFIEKEAFAPLKLRDDQSWLQLGTVTWVTAKYAPALTGTDPKQTLSDMIFERPDAYFKAETIDLLALPDLTQIRREYVPSIVEAARRKSTMAIIALVDKGGPDAIRKSLLAVKKDPPKDGVGLVTLVAAATGADISKQLRP